MGYTFRKRVKAMLEKRDDATFPADGWPWPWEDSRTTDYAYAFDETDGKVWASCFGRGWHDKATIDADAAAWEAFNNDETGEVPEPADLWDEDKTCVFPNMKAVQNVTLGPRSGLLIVSTER